MTGSKPRRVLVLGSGALQIGQAGEFDYSGAQALKALREDGVAGILVNPNIATIQTSNELAQAVYLLPVTPEFVEPILVKERIDGILLGFGGQTGLNCGLELEESGILERHGVRVLGTPVDTIRVTEDRRLFVEALDRIGVKTARSRAVSTVEAVLAAAEEIGYPVIMRGAFALGGRGSAVVRNADECLVAATRALGSVRQLLVEEYLAGWKEIEVEVVRDAADNCITVCAMENVDPMGIHTGESIVVAPCQTLDDTEAQLLRDLAIRTIRALGVVGECNIQYALDPQSREYRVIEVNARLSRSSALASKATGYPLAYVAAKIALGYTLPEIPNAITGTTTAFFEPALDYVVCKVPRWDLEKFRGVDPHIGPEMKSVGEVMSIGRSFPEALQKALRMLEVGADGLDPGAFAGDEAALEEAIAKPSPRRMFALAHAFARGWSVERVFALCAIDRFFLAEIARAVAHGEALRGRTLAALGAVELRAAKQDGFSDRRLGELLGAREEAVRARRRALGVRAHLAQIDTLAGEFPAQTNYLYLTYHADQSDVGPSERKKVLVLGSGAYRIGSSVEFDWCAVTAARTARELGYETTLLNCNPETVSTDYDTCDRLVFDELSVETVMTLWEDAADQGRGYRGVLVSMGGQTANNLAPLLDRAGARILGTAPRQIDRAEDRQKFSALLDELGIEQPRWARALGLDDLEAVVTGLGGYPVLVRPSYVLSGAAMRVAYDGEQLRRFLLRAAEVSREHPVVISKFERQAREIEVDAVASKGRIVRWAISEHIENAGVHSGDATLVLPPHRLYLGTVRQARRIAERLARALEVSGPFNIQLLARNDQVKVIECNLRASRSFPFVSKVLGSNFVAEATRAILGVPCELPAGWDPLDLDYTAVKVPQFSFSRLRGADPRLGVEMASTGEVACFGEDADEALLKGLVATGLRLPKRDVLLSIGPERDRHKVVADAWELVRQGRGLWATPETAAVLRAAAVPHTECTTDPRDTLRPRALGLLRDGTLDWVVSVPHDDPELDGVGYAVRRSAVDLDIPITTELWLARRIIAALGRVAGGGRGRSLTLHAHPWHRYIATRGRDR